jgi:hypothetical protein
MHAITLIIMSVPHCDLCLDGERTFKTTEKGMNFLRIHHKVQELIIQ